MAQQIDYKVTRSGREVYGGALPGLVEAAAAGQIRANDLVYDPTGDRWVFARNLPALAGFALRGRRAYGTEAGDRPGRITLEGRGLERQQERRRRAVRAVLLLSVLAVTLALVMMVPAGTDKRQLSEFIEGRDQPVGEVVPAGRGAARAAGRRQARRRARGRGGGRCDGRDGRGGRGGGRDGRSGGGRSRRWRGGWCRGRGGDGRRGDGCRSGRPRAGRRSNGRRSGRGRDGRRSGRRRDGCFRRRSHG
ncbi:MAG: hypothetical protein R3F65_20880 [bacterium]